MNLGRDSRKLVGIGFSFLTTEHQDLTTESMRTHRFDQ